MTGEQRDINFEYYDKTKNDLHLLQKIIKADLEVLNDNSINYLSFEYLNPKKYQPIIDHLNKMYGQAKYEEQ